MKVKLPTDDRAEEIVEREDDPSKDVLPPEDKEETVLEEEKDEAPEPSALELKIAHLEGKIDGMASVREEKPSAESGQEERDRLAKVQCQNDMSALDDETFRNRYRMDKLQANNAIHEFERNKEKTSNAMRIAELEAKSDLATKYPSFSKHYEKIKQTVKSDLSLEAQQDPARLKRAMEREILLIEKEQPTPVKKKAPEDPMRRRIVNDFEKPNGEDRSRRDAAKSDELAPELQEVGKRFGITSESQRKKFMNPYIPMDLGGGYRFEDPKRGFEKVVQK